MKFNSRYDPPQVDGWSTDQPSLTLQSELESTQIDYILRKYARMGLGGSEALSLIASQNPGSYADVSNVASFRDAMNVVTEATAQFDALPAEIRQEFGSAAGLADAFADPSKIDRLTELGLIARSEPSLTPSASVEPSANNSGTPISGSVSEPPAGVS